VTFSRRFEGWLWGAFSFLSFTLAFLLSEIISSVFYLCYTVFFLMLFTLWSSSLFLKSTLAADHHV